MTSTEIGSTPSFATKSDLAYERIKSAILAGEYPPGAALNQVLLAKAIGISTTPLREALKRLSAEGLVIFASHRDAKVTTLSVEESRDLLELRLSLDPLGVTLAAQRRSREDISRMRAAYAEMEDRRSPDDALDSDAHRRFHQTVYRASHNELLISSLDSLWSKAERYRILGLTTVLKDQKSLVKKRAVKAEEHEELLHCVVSGDGERGAQIMREHIVKSLEAQAASYLIEDAGGERSARPTPRD